MGDVTVSFSGHKLMMRYLVAIFPDRIDDVMILDQSPQIEDYPKAADKSEIYLCRSER